MKTKSKIRKIHCFNIESTEQTGNVKLLVQFKFEGNKEKYSTGIKITNPENPKGNTSTYNNCGVFFSTFKNDIVKCCNVEISSQEAKVIAKEFNKFKEYFSFACCANL